MINVYSSPRQLTFNCQAAASMLPCDIVAVLKAMDNDVAWPNAAMDGSCIAVATGRAGQVMAWRDQGFRAKIMLTRFLENFSGADYVLCRSPWEVFRVSVTETKAVGLIECGDRMGGLTIMQATECKDMLHAITVNHACFLGDLPDKTDADWILNVSKELGIPLFGGGNSTMIPNATAGMGHLRLGESLLLGRVRGHGYSLPRTLPVLNGYATVAPCGRMLPFGWYDCPVADMRPCNPKFVLTTQSQDFTRIHGGEPGEIVDLNFTYRGIATIMRQ